MQSIRFYVVAVIITTCLKMYNHINPNNRQDSRMCCQIQTRFCKYFALFLVLDKNEQKCFSSCKILLKCYTTCEKGKVKILFEIIKYKNELFLVFESDSNFPKKNLFLLFTRLAFSYFNNKNRLA